MSAQPIGPGKGWQPGAPITRRRDGAQAWIWRKGQKCKLCLADGTVLTEQKNVAPMLAWADQNGFRIL